MRVCQIQSEGAWWLRASLRTARSSRSSCGALALTCLGITLLLPLRNSSTSYCSPFEECSIRGTCSRAELQVPGRADRSDLLGLLLGAPPAAQDHILVDQGGDDGADDRPDPVNEIVLPEAASQGWAEGDGRIHRCTRQRSADQDIEGHRQADAKSPDFWRSWIDGG